MIPAAISCFLVPLASATPQPDDFVEVISLDPTIVTDLPYASENNFCNTKLYPVERCFLRREVAEKLVEAHKSLAPYRIGIKIWDGYRPRSVQWKMWEKSPSKGYVGDPKRGSKHNRGAAVDVTLVSLITMEELEMPTGYDEFSIRANSQYLKVKPNVFANRKLLQETMVAHGFKLIGTEWWHFDYADWEDFPLTDVPIEDLAADVDAKKNDQAESANGELPSSNENDVDTTGEELSPGSHDKDPPLQAVPIHTEEE